MTNKKVYTNTTLCCTFQERSEITTECLHGVISRTSDGFKFEEAVKNTRVRQNPRLFKGNYCSLFHMQNGKYQIHMKTIDTSAVKNPDKTAFKVYSEILDALKQVQ